PDVRLGDPRALHEGGPGRCLDDVAVVVEAVRVVLDELPVKRVRIPRRGLEDGFWRRRAAAPGRRRSAPARLSSRSRSCGTWPCRQTRAGRSFVSRLLRSTG